MKPVMFTQIPRFHGVVEQLVGGKKKTEWTLNFSQRKEKTKSYLPVGIEKI